MSDTPDRVCDGIEGALAETARIKADREAIRDALYAACEIIGRLNMWGPSTDPIIDDFLARWSKETTNEQPKRS